MRSQATLRQLAQQKAMIGHCLLHVLLYYPLGSGVMFDPEET